MNRLPETTTRPVVRGEVFYPATEDEPMAELPFHVLAFVSVIATLRYHFREHKDWYVIGNVFWYYNEFDSNAKRAPDLMLVKGVDPGAERRGVFKDWEEKARPCFVLELLSYSTADEDTEGKRVLYEKLGVHEYFLFDPNHEYLPRPLVGYRLIRKADNGNVTAAYEELVPFDDGSLPSTELGLLVKPGGEQVIFIDPATGQRLPDLPEAARLLDEVRKEMQGYQVRVQELEARVAELEARLKNAQPPNGGQS